MVPDADALLDDPSCREDLAERKLDRLSGGAADLVGVVEYERAVGESEEPVGVAPELHDPAGDQHEEREHESEEQRQREASERRVDVPCECPPDRASEREHRGERHVGPPRAADDETARRRGERRRTHASHETAPHPRMPVSIRAVRPAA